MTAPALHGAETPDELLFLGLPVAHVVAYYEAKERARIECRNREAARRATGSRFRGGVVNWA